MFKNILNINKTRNMSTFIQKLNRITGKKDWVIQNENYDYHQEVARAAFADMLHDTERNVMYEKALKVAIDHMHNNGKKANVLDIGTGTGLLSMMAVRHGADSVTACEAFKPMSICALDVIEQNAYEDKIKLIPKRSTELIIGVDLSERVNILVTEVFDTELIGEGALSTFKHAHDELLTKDCIVVPHSGTIYVQIIESPIVKNWNRINNIHNDDGELLIKAPDAIQQCAGTISLHDLQLSQFPIEYIKNLVSPQEVFHFDWSGKTDFIFQRSEKHKFKSERDGVAQAVFMWWDLKMDIHNEYILSCAPFWAHPAQKMNIPWRDHWMQAVYYFPNEVKVQKGQELNLVSSHDEYSLWFDLEADPKPSHPHCKCNLHIAYSRTRIGQLNDGRRLKKYLRLFENRVKAESVVLILGDGFFAALSVAKIARKVFVFESNTLSRRVINNFIRENALSNVQVIEDVKDMQENEDKIDVVLGEPYFVSGILPWDHMLFFYLVKDFENCLADEYKVFPAKMLIKAMPMEFTDLHKIRSPLGKCEGFKMKPFDKLIEASSEISDDNVEAQPLWEYPGKALAGSQQIASFDMDIHTQIDPIEKSGTFILESMANCNGIALWADWILDLQNEAKSTVTTGPIVPIEIGEKVIWDMHSKQGVCLLGNKKLGNVISYKFKYCFNTGTMDLKIY